jgi:hypothetical protein
MHQERKKIRVKRRTKTSKAKKMENNWGGEKPLQGIIGRAAKRGMYVAVALGVIGIVFIASSAYKGDKKLPPVVAGQEEKWIGPGHEVVAENFTKAATHEERLKWVRDPERVSASMKAFFEEGAGAKEKILGLDEMGATMNRNYTFARYQVRLDNEKSRMLAVVLGGQEAKVDFECYARSGTASWEDLLSGKTSESTETRVIMVKDEHYLFEFSDEKKWKSFLITSPDTEMPMHVYAERGSETEKSLIEIGLDTEKRVTIGLRSLGESYKRRQFEVTQLLTPGWVK